MTSMPINYYDPDAYVTRASTVSRHGVAGYSRVPKKHAGHYLAAFEYMDAVVRRLKAERSMLALHADAHQLLDRAVSARRDLTDGECRQLDRIFREFDGAKRVSRTPPPPRRRVRVYVR
jgi:hypothetical protein